MGFLLVQNLQVTWWVSKKWWIIISSPFYTHSLQLLIISKKAYFLSSIHIPRHTHTSYAHFQSFPLSIEVLKNPTFNSSTCKITKVCHNLLLFSFIGTHQHSLIYLHFHLSNALESNSYHGFLSLFKRCSRSYKNGGGFGSYFSHPWSLFFSSFFYIVFPSLVLVVSSNPFFICSFSYGVVVTKHMILEISSKTNHMHK